MEQAMEINEEIIFWIAMTNKIIHFETIGIINRNI